MPYYLPSRPVALPVKAPLADDRVARIQQSGSSRRLFLVVVSWFVRRYSL
jgi:hypothetical protein